MASQTYSKKSDGQGQAAWSDKMLARLKGAWPKFSVDKSSSEYGADFDAMAKEFGEPIVEEAITQLKRKVATDDPPAVGAFWESCREVSNQQIARKALWDKNCANCDEGWEEITFADWSGKEKDSAVRLYGFEKAHAMTRRRRCRLCWKGAK